MDRVPRNLNERTGKHYCIGCLREVPAEEYLRNDHMCDECARAQNEKRTPAKGKDD